MKKNAILCVLIAATLLVTVLVASAEAATINQTAASTTTNVDMTSTAPRNRQTVIIPNVQVQGAVAVETGDINIVGGNVANSSYEKAGSCEKNPSPATINQAAAPTTTNVNMTATAPRNRQTVIIPNVQVQGAGIVQTEDINVVVGNIANSSYSKVCPGPRAAPGPAPAPRAAPAPNGPAPRP